MGRIWTIKEEGCDLFKRLCADIHSTVNAIAGFQPVRFADSDCPACGLSSILVLNIKNVTAQDNSDAMKRVAVPRRCVSRGKP
jgi:hypothetical protein